MSLFVHLLSVLKSFLSSIIHAFPLSKAVNLILVYKIMVNNFDLSVPLVDFLYHKCIALSFDCTVSVMAPSKQRKIFETAWPKFTKVHMKRNKNR